MQKFRRKKQRILKQGQNDKEVEEKGGSFANRHTEENKFLSIITKKGGKGKRIAKGEFFYSLSRLVGKN
mgnify:CR=1 FL=1